MIVVVYCSNFLTKISLEFKQIVGFSNQSASVLIINTAVSFSSGKHHVR